MEHPSEATKQSLTLFPSSVRVGTFWRLGLLHDRRPEFVLVMRRLGRTLSSGPANFGTARM